MSVRPQPARWFELLTSREQLRPALAALAATGAVQLQTTGTPERRATLPELGPGLEEWRDTARRFGTAWPAPRFDAQRSGREPQVMLEDALRGLRAWIVDAAPLIADVQRCEGRLDDLGRISDVLARAGGRLPPLALLSGAGPVLGCAVFELAPAQWPAVVPARVMLERVAAGERAYLVAAGPRADVDALADRLVADKARRLVLPEPPQPGTADAAHLGALTAATRDRIAALRERLDVLATRHDLARSIADLQFVDWFASHVPSLPATEHFAWLTGWTNAGESRLRTALGSAGVPHVLHFPAPPPGLDPPVTLSNPRWARPFEFFARLLGTPGLAETDPSVILAVLAPLVFGIMFADVGQGAVVLLAGLLLQRRLPLLRLLVPGGIAAMVFGLLFGSVFAREDILAPLWFRPLDRPLDTLRLALALGAAVVLLGLALEALQSTWAGQGRRWVASRAGLVVAYVATLAAFVEPALGWAALAGAAWFLLGSTLASGPGARLAHLGPAAGELLETALQLGVNTLSFLRVGAFALAHGGLSIAIVGLAAATGNAWGGLLVLVAGNAVVILVEVLVAGIQTTRLVLFEFFVRFLRGVGREFRPLPALPQAGGPSAEIKA